MKGKSLLITIETPSQYHSLIDQGRVVSILGVSSCGPCNLMKRDLENSTEVREFLEKNEITVLYVDQSGINPPTVIDDVAIWPTTRARDNGKLVGSMPSKLSPEEFIQYASKWYKLSRG